MASYYAKKCPKLPWMIDFYSTNEGKIQNAQYQAAFAERTLDHLCQLNVASKVPAAKLTQIMCTLTPEMDDVSLLTDMMEAGMSIARLKMSFFSMDDAKNLIKLIRQANDKCSKRMRRVYPLAIAIELKGPEIRTGSIKDPLKSEIELSKGDTVDLTTNTSYEEHVSEDMIFVDYQKMPEIVEPGDKVYLDNGSVTLEALEIVGSIIRCIIRKAGSIASAAKVSVPEVPVDLPPISEKDLEDLNMAIEQDVDIVMVPNVKNAEVLRYLKEQLNDRGKGLTILAKIEDVHGIDNLDEIIEECDGIVLARGSVGLTVLQEKIFLAQKSVIAKCNKAGVPVVVTSHQIFESMADNPVPTKPEISDIVGIVMDGSDCIILSQKIVSGPFILDALRSISNVCREGEAAVYERQLFSDLSSIKIPTEAFYAVAISTVDAALKTNAAAIVVCTTCGRSARILSRYRPRCPIICLTRFAHVARQLMLYRGVYPILFIKPKKDSWVKDIEERVQLGITFGKVSGFIRAGDVIIIVTGSRQGSGFTNNMKIFYASEYDTVIEPFP